MYYWAEVIVRMILLWLINSLLLAGCKAEQRRFPGDFFFGVSTAAYQIEGAWNLDGKGPSIWDHLVHSHPDAIKDSSNGDIAADSYHHYKRDVEMLRELGVDAYRFSLSWPRILPNGFPNKINQAGVDFYNNYINELLKYNITPIVTMYHWDLPQKLQELGGFSSPLIADWFEDYARLVFQLFGDRVKQWITFNEPSLICYAGYGNHFLAPGLNVTDVGTYYCAKNLIMAHARAFHLYDDEFRRHQRGIIGISLMTIWYGPLTESPEDALATELTIQGESGLYAHPIFFDDGGHPTEFSELIKRKSLAKGYSKSRLPELSAEEKALVIGTADFFGINHYTGLKVSTTKFKRPHPESSFFDDLGVGFCVPEEWEKTSKYHAIAPDSLYHVIADVSRRYNNPPIIITENGWPTPADVGLEDDQRVRYFRKAWESLLNALDAGYNVKGYLAWSLMDNFEWRQGYLQKYGLYEVDFSSPDRTRTPKKSAFVYKELIRSRVVDHHYSPNTTMWTRRGHQ